MADRIAATTDRPVQRQPGPSRLVCPPNTQSQTSLGQVCPTQITLYDYLMATGAEGAGIGVTVHGQRIELDLARLRDQSGKLIA